MDNIYKETNTNIINQETTKCIQSFKRIIKIEKKNMEIILKIPCYLYKEELVYRLLSYYK